MGKGYIPAEETVNAARMRKLSVGDYLEELWHTQGSRQRVIDNLKSLRVFEKAETILEIGPGSGMFLEKTLDTCHPTCYQIYEIAQDWIAYLLSEYANRITAQPADGKTLSATLPESVDLAQAHGVFVYLSFLNSYSYFKELARVVKPSGFVAFDMFDEECFTNDIVEKWLMSTNDYPCFLGKEYVTTFFLKRGFVFCGDFFRVVGEGVSHYLVFQKL